MYESVRRQLTCLDQRWVDTSKGLVVTESKLRRFLSVLRRLNTSNWYNNFWSNGNLYRVEPSELYNLSLLRNLSLSRLNFRVENGEWLRRRNPFNDTTKLGSKGRQLPLLRWSDRPPILLKSPTYSLWTTPYHRHHQYYNNGKPLNNWVRTQHYLKLNYPPKISSEDK